MLANYIAIYHDVFGEERTTIQNDGKSLRMVIRGVEFHCTMLDDWEPIMTINDSQKALFPLYRNELHSYTLDFEIPVSVSIGDKLLPSRLQTHIELGKPRANGVVDHERLQLGLVVDGRLYKSSKKNQGWFEDALLEIHRQLPEDAFIKSCFSCAYSDYSPAGYGLFGCMACFRNSKETYTTLKGKEAYFKLMDQIVEFVQETYLCPEFEKRKAGTGYRG